MKRVLLIIVLLGMAACTSVSVTPTPVPTQPAPPPAGGSTPTPIPTNTPVPTNTAAPTQCPGVKMKLNDNHWVTGSMYIWVMLEITRNQAGQFTANLLPYVYDLDHKTMVLAEPKNDEVFKAVIPNASETVLKFQNVNVRIYQCAGDVYYQKY